MAELFVSIGSNLDRERSLRGAVAALRREFGTLLLSPVYESSAIGFIGPPFYNLVAGLESSLAPVEVIATMRGIERALGRADSDHGMCSRTVDLDLLLYDGRVESGHDYQLPRDEIMHYAFVLGPLADLAPDLCHPVSGRHYAELWADFDHAAQPLTAVPFDWGQ